MRVVLRPLICFGTALAWGVFGIAHTKLTNNGIWFIEERTDETQPSGLVRAPGHHIF
jgi:hypothetical protein